MTDKIIPFPQPSEPEEVWRCRRCGSASMILPWVAAAAVRCAFCGLDQDYVQWSYQYWDRAPSPLTSRWAKLWEEEQLKQSKDQDED